ncbi:hypothetical protein [Gudongella sp. SC589]|uniref:hypothetical protein n=1 Tax=Gudongella sp. SC589 TaxID=3385990 RepID=UPI0039049ABD
MKKLIILVIIFAMVFTLVGCAGSNTVQEDLESGKEPAAIEEKTSLKGTYVGYSWKDEAKGVEFEDATQYIETILNLDEEGIIEDAKVRFFVMKDGYWTMRQSGNAYVELDYSIDPTPAHGGEEYKAGDSMFKVYTSDMMAFYAVGVSEDSTTALVMVDPITRYQFEMKIPQDFDLSLPVGQMTIGSGLTVPTVRTSGSRAAEWDGLAENMILNISPWSHVVTKTGALEGITEDSTVQEFLEAFGVEFENGTAVPQDVIYGYYGTGGWNGNMNAIADSLVGKDAKEFTSLIDWSDPRYAGAINEENVFGVDVASGATGTVQNSMDTISGATVRVSREATSFQRALVDAGILQESDVIIGKF